jgi:tRNA dimethylallyltransferase
MIASEPAPPAILLMGPTASGKSGLAIRLAQTFPLDVVSVDSVLVYRGLDIGTAKPDAAERGGVPHHLIDIVEPETAYSAGRFRDDAIAAMQAIRARGRLPLLTGGTLLYFRALTEGLAAMPPADAAVRAALEGETAERGAAAMHGELTAIDPAAAERIHPNDPQRVQRALEVYRLTGHPISAYQRRAGDTGAGDGLLRLAVVPDHRERLHRRIAERFDAMLAQGLIEEVARLRQRPGLHADLPAMRAVGYRQVWQYLDGHLDYAGLRERGAVATRQLAKRQLTWLRGLSSVERVASEPDPFDALAARIHAYLQGSF